jgi:hypothetical protein
MRQLEFIRAGLTFELLVVDRVEDILPKLFEAAGRVTAREMEMAPVAAERL